MRRNLIFPLACSLLLLPLTANAASLDNEKVDSMIPSGETITIAGFLDSINSVKDTVEGVRDGVDATNEITTDSIDAVHGVNEGVGNTQQIMKGGGESNDSTIIEQTQVSETTEEQIDTTDSDSF